MSSSQVLGPWKTITVSKGDKVEATAYAYYPNATQSSGSRIQLLPFLNAGTFSSPNPEGTGNQYPLLQLGLAGAVLPSTPEANVPTAYLQYLFYNEQGQLVHSGLSQVTSAAGTSWQTLSISFLAPEAGRVQVLVANESAKPTYFDDISITYQPTMIVQSLDYDPWGLELAGIGKLGTHDYTYNSKEKQTEYGLGWLDYGARMYDPVLGRWHSLDPLADQMRRHSPYNYAFDNPIRFIDPDGRAPGECCGPWYQLQKGFGRLGDKLASTGEAMIAPVREALGYADSKVPMGKDRDKSMDDKSNKPVGLNLVSDKAGGEQTMARRDRAEEKPVEADNLIAILGMKAGGTQALPKGSLTEILVLGLSRVNEAADVGEGTGEVINTAKEKLREKPKEKLNQPPAFVDTPQDKNKPLPDALSVTGARQDTLSSEGNSRK